MSTAARRKAGRDKQQDEALNQRPSSSTLVGSRIDTAFQKRTLRTVVVALLIDILAFTIILPLYPRLIAHYETVDGKDPTTFYYAAAQGVRMFRDWIGGTGSRLDIIIFGGCLGSLFSFLQFISSPVIGRLSDKYGRRNVLLISMVGNAVSMLLWIFSASFPVFVLSRIVGGLTEGNVQMSIAMISDITTPAERSRALAWVGISFALGFTVGPPALFPSLPINRYSSPALFAFVLIIIETWYLLSYLPETSHLQPPLQPSAASMASTSTDADADADADASHETKPLIHKDMAEGKSATQDAASQLSSKEIDSRLLVLSLVHFAFLFSFSGMEFTLTFLTHDRFAFSHSQQGKLLAFMGVFSAIIQGGYVRRVAHKHISEQSLVLQGIISCCIGLGILSVWATTVTRLYIGASFLAFTSGTVVNSLTSLASLTHSGGSASKAAGSNAGQDSGNRGHALGKFRSLGQLGRTFGPLFACSVYWMLGSQRVYLIAAASMAVLAAAVYMAVPSPPRAKPLLAKSKLD
ncbi:major facilitator superfamily domain-containing protein [Entophlyctis helioformis]|nr:major facilitator superfamily domain-containing protein [Entophlyctis helioformis]